MKIEIIEIANFRRLKSVRIGVSGEKTVLVGANNSGKTSAMHAIRQFLVERDRSRFSLNDFTLSYLTEFDAIGSMWEKEKNEKKPLSNPSWDGLLPFLDVWLNVEISEAHLVQELIPNLSWRGGLVGVRFRLEPKNIENLRKDYLTARAKVQQIEEEDRSRNSGVNRIDPSKGVLWPSTLSEYLRRDFRKKFQVRFYILNPSELKAPAFGLAQPQKLEENIDNIEQDPLNGLIRVDEISAQRGFGQSYENRDRNIDGDSVELSAARKMSRLLSNYWVKHLDPTTLPNPKDIDALIAIQGAQQAFDERLEGGFLDAIGEIESMGYPGVTDPRLKISSRLKPEDTLNHDAAVQYVLGDSSKGKPELKLPESSNGLGYQNLIFIIFRLMSFRDEWMRVGKRESSVNSAGKSIEPIHLVLVEEPEAYLHIQVQQVFIRQAYEVLRNKNIKDPNIYNTQMIVSTHSSHIAYECEFDQLRYFRRMSAKGEIVPVSHVVNLGLIYEENEIKHFVSKYIKLTHCDLLFADAAVFIEGNAERILTPLFISSNEELSHLSNCYISWLEIGGSHSHRFRQLIEHLGLTTLIITDLDVRNEKNKSVIPQRKAGLKTRNQTLITWCPEKEDLDELLDLNEVEKCKIYEDQQFSIRVAYQSPVQIDFLGRKQEALCYTLEDALVMENLELISSLDNSGLWAKFKKAIEEKKSIQELSQAFKEALSSGDKVNFALDLLEILNNGQVLNTPNYIYNGLKWLSDQLIQRQHELSNSGLDDSGSDDENTKEDGALL